MSHNYIHLEETSSTNTYLKELIYNQNQRCPITVYTDFQSAGRGQRGSSWEADRGTNLLFSTLLFPSELRADQQFILSETISLAIKIVLDSYTDNISIKWPNDIYWKEKKIAGILIENAIQDSYIEYSIIGVGLNLNQKIFRSDAPNPISLYQITDQSADPKEILDQIIKQFYLLLDQISALDIHNLYMQSLFWKDGYHLYKKSDCVFKAKIENVQPNGILQLLDEDGTCHDYAFKEVQFLL